MVGSIPSNRFNVVGEIERRGRRVQEKIVVETMPKKCTHFVFSKIRNNDKHNLLKKKGALLGTTFYTQCHTVHMMCTCMCGTQLTVCMYMYV